MTTAPPDATPAPPRDFSTAEQQRRAQSWVRAYVTKNGVEPTGEMVGTQFGMKERWGRNQIAAVRETDGGTPARRPGTSGTTARGTVGDAVAAQEAARVADPNGTDSGTSSGTSGPATAVIGTATPAQPPARPASPPAGAGTTPARPSGTTGTRAPARPDTADRAAPASDQHGGGGQFVAWLGFGLGAFVSIAANVMHALIPRPPEGVDPSTWTVPEGWAPDMAAVLGAAVWPLMLLVAVEVMSRVRWAKGWGWSLARYGGVGTVGLGSAIISYGHIRDVLLAWHYGEFSAHIGPLVVDGLMVISGFALLSISQAARDGGRP